jgi:2-polyprenyl-6-methoxyphenol hydroxylase-like FAD-dependent oxidoreductase
VEWIFGDTVTALDPGADGVRVTFARTAPRGFDLVLGADGLHSAVRALAFGPPERFVHDLGSRMAIFTAPNELGIERWQLSHNAPGRVASVKTDPGNATIKVNLLFGGAGDVDHRDRDAQRRHVAAAFAGCGWHVPRLLEHLRTAPDFYYAPNAQVRMDAWTRGRVALVGDAGYCPSPLTGQGTGLALVGAYVLAHELAVADGDHVPAFARYETVLRDFVELNQRAALGPAKGFAPRSAREVWLRDLSIRMLPYMPWRHWIFEAMTRDTKRASEALELGTDDGHLLRIGGDASM